ncbi:interleukin-3-like [Alexandromys fortis]|uniref:interleukin-3-like n=1 Tax=Alexandromys fortis TaxID=100897 RepID=UPI00215358BA|nr:interleukin-3-like [Microtus fortis]
MALVSSNTSLLSLLLLFLMLLHQGLQTPVPPSVSASGKASKLNCNIIAEEILSSIEVSIWESDLTEDNVRMSLQLSYSPAVTHPQFLPLKLSPPHPTPSSHLPSFYTEDSLPSQNDTLRRANLCEFLRMGNVSKIDKLKTKLEILGRCLPKVESTSEMTDIFLTNDEKDFNKKLRYFVSQLYDLLPTPIPTTPDPTSDPVTSCSVTME